MHLWSYYKMFYNDRITIIQNRNGMALTFALDSLNFHFKWYENQKQKCQNSNHSAYFSFSLSLSFHLSIFLSICVCVSLYRLRWSCPFALHHQQCNRKLNLFSIKCKWETNRKSKWTNYSVSCLVLSTVLFICHPIYCSCLLSVCESRAKRRRQRDNNGYSK